MSLPETMKTRIAITKRIPLDATGIFSTVQLSNPDDPDKVVSGVRAMWDTGASISTICQTLFEQLALEPGNKVYLYGVFSEYDSFKTYACVTVCIDGIAINTIMAVVPDEFSRSKSPDIVLGLDFIAKGAFAISHDADGYPIFSFTYPTPVTLDYIEIVKGLNFDVASEEPA